MSKPKKIKRLLRFTEDDPGGLWRKHDAVADLGWETVDDRGEPTTDVRLLKLVKTGELLSVSEPFRRGLVEKP